MNKDEKKFLEWLEKEKEKEKLRAVKYAVVHGDTGLADKTLEPLVDAAVEKAIQNGGAEELIFHDSTEKK